MVTVVWPQCSVVIVVTCGVDTASTRSVDTVTTGAVDSTVCRHHRSAEPSVMHSSVSCCILCNIHRDSPAGFTPPAGHSAIKHAAVLLSRMLGNEYKL